MKYIDNKVDYIFETSWEVCNKVGGIYTVLSTKAKSMAELCPKAQIVFVGPDLWTKEKPSPYFIEYPSLLRSAMRKMQLPFDLKVRVGRWNIPGKPIAVLVDFNGVYPMLPEIQTGMWESFGVDSLNAYGDYNEGCAFSVASAMIISNIISHLKADPNRCIAHFDEWTTAMGLLYLRKNNPGVATVFTTHATSIGRSICGNNKPLYDYFTGYNGDQMACELNMQSKHSLEKQAAHYADAFTTVSELTGRECTQLLQKTPDVITPNGFESDFIPSAKKFVSHRKAGRGRLFQIVERMTGEKLPDDTFVIATAGRNEYRNKGLDIYIDAVNTLRWHFPENGRCVLALILVPAWVAEPKTIFSLNFESEENCFMTHRLYNEDSDAVAQHLSRLSVNAKEDKVKFVYIPCYLDGADGVLNIAYYDFMPALDATIFASYYEPWGYTPLESIAFGCPTVSTDKSGFGQWIEQNGKKDLCDCGVRVIERTDSSYAQTVQQISDTISQLITSDKNSLKQMSEAATKTSQQALWNKFIQYYGKAYAIALENRDKRNK